MDVRRVRLGVEVRSDEGRRGLNLRALFAAFDLRWDERAEAVFDETMRALEERDRAARTSGERSAGDDWL